MSYQFEDESALEELLNQQLDRRKQQPPSESSSAARASRRSASIQRGSINQLVTERPSTAFSKQATFDEPISNEPAKGRLASWLEAKSTRLDPSETSNVALSSNAEKTGNTTARYPVTAISNIPQLPADQKGSLIEDQLTDDYLQSMSKQRLIQLILEEILPPVKAMRQSINRESAFQVEQIKDQLEIERGKTKSLEAQHLEQVKLVESRWIELNKKIEARLELAESELNKTTERHKSFIGQLEEEHREQISRLIENYDSRLADERRQFEESQKRREEFHHLELESKLKVDWDQAKLETIFQEWQKKIQSTIVELELQFKSVESLLDKQTIEINGTNTELAKRCKQVVEQYEKFEMKGEQLNRLVTEINEILPRFSRIQADSEQLTKQTSDQLHEFLLRNDDLQVKEAELNKLRNLVTSEREQLSKERFQFGLDANKLSYKEERLDELVKSTKETECRLAEQAARQDTRESQLEAKRASLDLRNGQLRLQDYELHLTRKRHAAKEEQLNKLANDLEVKKEVVGNQLAQVRTVMDKLIRGRECAQKELSQLRRLQKSLICSLCLDRLFAGNQRSGPFNKLKSSSAQIYADNVDFRMQSAQIKSDLATSENETHNKDFLVPNMSGHDANQGGYKSKSSNFEDELSRIDRLIKRDARQIETENKYVELLSAN